MKLILLYVALLVCLIPQANGCIKTAKKINSYIYGDNMHKFLRHYPMLPIEDNHNTDFHNSQITFSYNSLSINGQDSVNIFGCKLFCEDECILQYFTYIDSTLRLNHLYTNNTCEKELTEHYMKEPCMVDADENDIIFTLLNDFKAFIQFRPSTPEVIYYNINYYDNVPGNEMKAAIKAIKVEHNRYGLTLKFILAVAGPAANPFNYKKASTCYNYPILNNNFNPCKEGFTYVKSIHQTYSGIDMYMSDKFLGCVKVDKDTNTLSFYYLKNVGILEQIKIIKVLPDSTFKIIGSTHGGEVSYYTIYTDINNQSSSLRKNLLMKMGKKRTYECGFEDFILYDAEEGSRNIVKANDSKIMFLKQNDFEEGNIFGDKSTKFIGFSRDLENGRYFYNFYDLEGAKTRKEFLTRDGNCADALDFKLAENFKCDIKNGIFYVIDDTSKLVGEKILSLKVDTHLGAIKVFSDGEIVNYIFYENIKFEEKSKLKLKVSGYDLKTEGNLYANEKKEDFEFVLINNKPCWLYLEKLIGQQPVEKKYTSEISYHLGDYDYNYLSYLTSRFIQPDNKEAITIKRLTIDLTTFKLIAAFGESYKSEINDADTKNYYLVYTTKQQVLKIWLNIITVIINPESESLRGYVPILNDGQGVGQGIEDMTVKGEQHPENTKTRKLRRLSRRVKK
jgi:hypothetical protein